MNDLISRQAAINEIARWKGYIDEDMILRIQTGLKKVPSAQPEIVRCRECKRWNTVIDRNKAEYGLCQKRSQLEATKADFYCADAERRTDE